MYIRQGDFRVGLFVRRDNRFIVWVRYQDNLLRCHLPNPGRMVYLLIEEKTELVFEPSTNPKRKTAATVIAIKTDSFIINLDTQMFRPLLESHFGNGLLTNWQLIKAEYTYGNHRFDFLLNISGRKIMTEVKSTTRVVNKIACFPDAVSKRASSHLETLGSLEELETMVIFLVYQPAEGFSPCREIDPGFALIFDKYHSSIEYRVFQVQGNWLDESKLGYEITGELSVIY